MTTAISNEALSNAIVQAVETGAYPDAEEVASAEIAASVLPAILKELSQARQRVQLEMKQLSQDVAPDIDGWVQQAKQLQLDIERSRATARDIVREAEEASRLRSQHHDLSMKVVLLTEEVDYTRRLDATFTQIQAVANGLNAVKEAARQGDYNGSLDHLEEVEAGLVMLRPYETSQSVELLTQRAGKTRKDLIEDVMRQVDNLIQVDNTASSITVNERLENVTLESIFAICSRLTLLDSIVARLCRNLDNVILKQRFGTENGTSVPMVETRGNQLRLQGNKPNTGAVDAIDDLLKMATFFHESLPAQASVLLSEDLMPLVLSYLLSFWLPASMPLSVDRIDELQALLARVLQFSKELSGIGWTGHASLNEWVDTVPRHWIAKRREWSLASVRSMLSQQTRRSKTVERVETQTVSDNDVIAPNSASNENWDAGWSDDEVKSVKSVKSEALVDVPQTVDEDDETSAWETGDEDDTVPKSPVKATLPPGNTKEPNVDDEGDAWGWNEGDSVGIPASPVAVRNPPLPPRPSQDDQLEPLRRMSTQKQLTLRETYSTTLVPESLFQLIKDMIQDADTLRTASYARSPIASAAVALNSLPTLVIASYRALAPTFYHIHSPTPGAGNMYIYNDASYLAEQLTAFSATHTSHNPTSRLKLDTDVDALYAFARRAYGREMDNQRTILRDLLDGAQGFASCTEPPFAAACADAVSQTVDRIRDVSRMWSSVLSRGALLQSLGSLLSAVLSKVILEIEELGDIGENESAKLREFCTTISTLSDLFKTTGAKGAEEGQDMTGVYTPQWFKFQYLGEILEASLADIKYLWQQGELSLEFDKEELIDLMQALFAESDYRRRAISEIRRA